ncbi:MAG: PQQ-binding-like beta-propeller repeat protein [Kiritimatiellales bacterium]|nr:PQQ-binding-like beta-propeller repeat protein [Kiritimatiellales bacterium]
MKKELWLFIGWFTLGASYGNIGGFCASLDVEGSNAYVGAGQILLAIDVSDTAAPSLTDSIYLPGLIEDVLVDGTNLYAACGDAGLHRVDVSSPGSMELLDTFDSPGHAYGLALNGSALYLADGVAGLQVLDAVSLSLTDSFFTNGPAMDVVADGSSIYLLDHFNGVMALDASLNETGSYGMIAFGNRMVSDGTTLYVADCEGKITQLDRITMTLITSELAGIPSLTVAVSGSDVFVARGDAGVQVLGGAVLATPGRASGLAVDDGKLYVADGFGGLSIFDAFSKSPLGSFSAVARSRATAVAGGMVYMASGNEGVKIFDLADFSLLSSVTCSNALDVAVTDGLLLVADAFTGLETFDLTSPVAPAHLNTYTSASPAIVRCVGAAGSSAYIATAYNVHKLDISNPASPVWVDSYTSSDYVFDLDVSGTNLLLSTAGGLEVLSEDLLPVAETAVASQIHSVSADDETVLAGWSLIDLSDPLTPVVSSNFPPLVRALQLTLSGGTIYASADDGGTAIVPMPVIMNDSDGDGLDDSLEQLIIDFDPEDEFVDLDSVHPDDDFDGDGLSNLHEQLAGTSPVDPGSVFAICGLVEEGTGHAISWYSSADHSYTVHKSTNLVEGFHVLQADIPATAPINVFVDPDSGNCAMYMITINP